MPPSKGCFYLFAAGSESLWLGEPPAQAPPQLPARRVLQLGERGFCPGGRASRFRVEATGPEGLRLGEPLARREQRGIISNGVNLSAEFNATTG